MEGNSITTLKEKKEENGVSTTKENGVPACADVSDKIVDDKGDAETKSDAETFTCKVCDKPYKKKGCFEKHMKLHSNSKKLKSQKVNNVKSVDKGSPHDDDFKPHKKLRARKPAKRGRKKKKPKDWDSEDSSDFDMDGDFEKVTDEEDTDVAIDKIDEDEDDDYNGDKLQCKVCNRSFTKREKLSAHMNVHGGERPFPCSICNKRFIRRDHLKAHIKRHSNPVRFSCEKCGESFKREDHLRYHKINNHGGTIYLNELKVFNKTERKNLEKTVLCEVCGKGFVDQNRLKIHKKIHTDSKRYQCKYCHRSFSNSSNFNVHVRLHTGKNPYKCVVCGECFRTSSKLKTHTRKHTGEYPFVCQICGKLCGEKHLLQMHMQTHTDQKLHECSYCRKSFAHSSTLHAHIRLHTGSKPFVCQVCGHSFAQVSSLNYHKRTHTGEKPYTCHICGNSYTRKTTLTTHLSRHSGTKLVTCTMCDFTCYTAKQRKKHMSIAHNISTGAPKSSVSKVNKVVNAKQELSNVQQMYKQPNEDVDLKSSMTSTLQPLTSSVNEQMDFSGQLDNSDAISMTSYSSMGDTKTNGSSNNNNMPLYYNATQGFVNLSEMAQPVAPQFSTNHMSNPHMMNSNFSPAPAHNHQGLQNLSSSSQYLTSNTAQHYSTYPSTTADTGTIDPNASSMQHNNGVNFSTKAPSFSPSMYFEPVSLPNSCGQNAAINSQNQSQFSNASTMPMIQGKNYDFAGQRMTNDNKSNIWLTIGTSSSILAQNQRISNERIPSTGVRGSVDSSHNSITNRPLMHDAPKDLIHKAMVSAEINAQVRETPTEDMGHDDLPATPEDMSAPPDDMPSISGGMPAVSDGMSAVSNGMPAVSDRMSAVSNSMPAVSDGVSAVSDGTPTVSDAMPAVSDGMPTVSDDMPTASGSMLDTPDDILTASVDIPNASDDMTAVSVNTLPSETKDIVHDKDSSSLKTEIKTKVSVNDQMSRPKLCMDSLKNDNVKKEKCKKKKATKSLPVKDQEELNDDLSEEEYCPPTRFRKVKKVIKYADSESDFKENESDDNEVRKKPKRRKSLRVKLMTQTNTKSKQKMKSSKGRGRNSSKKYAAKVTKVAKVKAVKKKVKEEKIEMKDEIGSDTEVQESETEVQESETEVQESETEVRATHKRHYTKHVFKKDKIFHCSDCDMSFSRPQYLNKHLATHKKHERYTCLYCLRLFDKKISIVNHMHNEHPGQHPFSCNVCNFSCIDVSELKHHIKTLHYDIEYKCHICCKTFSKSKYLKDHMSQNHEGSQAFVCQTCDKSFAECSLLVLHNKHKHSGVRPYKCNLCSKVLVAAAKLQNHLRAHTGDKPYTCEFCGKVFAHLSLLNIHVKAHSSIKPFVCNYCGYSFTHKSTLKAHVRTHTGVKPFKCDLCDKSFAQLSSLNYHRKSHDGLKPFTCELCGKSFTRSTTLKTHLMQHEGKKRFSCELCDFKCNRKHGLRKHHSKKHSGLESEDKPLQAPASTNGNNQEAKSDIPNDIHHEYAQKHENVIINALPPLPPPASLPSPVPAQQMRDTAPPLCSTLTSLLQLPLSSSEPPQPLQQQMKIHHHHHHSHHPHLLHHQIDDQQACKTSEGRVVKEAMSVPFFYQSQQEHHHHQQQQQLHPVHPAPPPSMTMLGHSASVPSNSFITLQTLHHYHQNN